jgi:hypothetical protein
VKEKELPDWDPIGLVRVIAGQRDALQLRSMATGRELWFPKDSVHRGEFLRPGDQIEALIDPSFRHVWRRELEKRSTPLCWRDKPEKPFRRRRSRQTTARPR